MRAERGQFDHAGAFEHALEAARASDGRVVLITGAAGLGKSRLLSEILVAAERRGFEIHAGYADPVDSGRPFGPVLDALGISTRSPDQQRRSIARMALTEAQAGPGDRRRSPRHTMAQQLLDDVTALVESITSDSPLLFALDNLHWANPTTLRTFAHLARATPRLPLLLVGTMRPQPWSIDLARIMSGPIGEAAELVELHPLEKEAVAELAASTLGARPGPRLAAQVAAAGGNPRLITELLAALLAETAIKVRRGVAEINATALPESILSTIRRRLATLDEPTIGALRVAACLGGAFSAGDLTAVSELPATTVLAALTAAVNAEVLGESGNNFAFTNEVWRAAFYDDQPAIVRKALHMHIGRRLADSGAPTARVAGQLALGAAPGDADTVAWLRRAAAETLRRAPMVAQELLEHVVRLSAPDYADYENLRVEQATALVASGRVAQGERLARSVLAQAASPETRRAARGIMAWALRLQGRWKDAADEWEVLGADADVSRPERAGLVAQAALARAMTGQSSRAEALATTAVSEGTEAGAADAVCIGLLGLGISAAQRAEAGEAVELSERALAVVRSDNVRTSTASLAHLVHGVHLTGADRIDEAEAQLLAGRRLGGSVLGVLRAYDYDAALGALHFVNGDWDSATRELGTVLGAAPELRAPATAQTSQILLAAIALHRDDMTMAADLIRLLRLGFGDNHLSDLAAGSMALVSALVLEDEGDALSARAELEQAWMKATNLGLFAQRMVVGPDLVRLLMSLGNTKRAVAVATGIDQTAAVSGIDGDRATALRCQGLATRNADLLVAAAEIMRGTPRVLARAQACEDAGSALGLAGYADDGAVLVAEALRDYRRLGAQRDAARAMSVTRQLGVHPGGRRGSMGNMGWGSLSATESKVVALVAEGLTNRAIGKRLYISDRTVETHLSHIFKKLKVSSRVELAAASGRAHTTEPDSRSAG